MFEDTAPLAERMRPKSLSEIIGQSHLVGGRQGILRNAIISGRIPSIIFWGPPGTGKTTLANIIANEVKVPFHVLSAINAGVNSVREVIAKVIPGQKNILFIDEIHRFNKFQQDALLGAVEKGEITLIGATTENPSFEVNGSLLSRVQVYQLNPLTTDELNSIMMQAIAKDINLKTYKVIIKQKAVLFNLSGGDARKLLNLLEQVVISQKSNTAVITDALVMNVAQQKAVIYDQKKGIHYDIISAFIKSIRGSDPNAAVYYLARMIEGGEEVKFIARRLVILAAEDIGNANPTALVMATSTFQAVSFIGYPESRIVLAQCATYLASSPKSNSIYKAINEAQAVVERTGNLSVPMELRNSPYQWRQTEGFGNKYEYAHDHSGNFILSEFLPSSISGTKFYDPGSNPREEELRKQLRDKWKEKYEY
tara:strand:+ start:226 stop:1497 length:1272 start_codon:yes stop_codon:yes gene_type:complete